MTIIFSIQCYNIEKEEENVKNLKNNNVGAGLCPCPNFEETDKEKNKIIFPNETVIGALAKYISTPNKNFQPMNANFGILPELEEKIRDKKQRYEKLAQRSIEYFNDK